MIAIICKATIVLAAAFCAVEFFAGRSALRHVIWTASLAAVLALPASGLFTPSWTPVVAQAPALAATVAIAAAAEAVPGAPLPWFAMLYGAGALITAVRFLAGALRVSWIVRRAAPARPAGDYGVRVLSSPDAPMPLAWGIFQPVILLPTVRAVLDSKVDRRPVTRRSAVAVALAAVAVIAPLTTVGLRAQTVGGTITGIVQDPSGARIPNCQVIAKNLDGTNQEVARANAAGEYRFAGIPAGRYSLEFATPGFMLGKFEVAVVTGALARVDALLVVGQMRETVTVSAPRLGPAPVPQTAVAPQRIRVGGNVTPTRLLRQPRAVYPPELQQAGVEGVVRLRAIISKEGTVMHPQVINSIDPRFAKAALDAVSQWLYQPALLNGEPIETMTTIDVAFELAQ